MNTWKISLMVALLSLAIPASASAFCGFYVGGADADLYADATQVALMRVGNQTALSMSNRYDGPAEDFALVVPVPVVLMQDDVKTLDESVFGKIDQLSSPRLVEYWEMDPCQEDFNNRNFDSGSINNGATGNNGTNNGVVVEAQFKVGEYEISILSSDDATALETWLSDNSYNIPTGAAPYFTPYIESGMYFFVAKVDVTQVRTVNGKTVLSPLRFSYQSDEFSLPVRLGMINSQGQQDLLVYILSPNQRFELANYPNVTIPTNIEVVDDVRNDFGTFYESLFARTLKENPGAVVTEYSWNASSCDPCPGPTLFEEDFLTLGADVLNAQNTFDWVLTRLHARYDKNETGEDLVFKTADPIVGGREFLNEDGTIEKGSLPGSINNFQGRYIIRHAWEEAVECDDPVYGRWGGPDGLDTPATTGSASPNTTGGDVFPETGEVEDLVKEDIPELNVIGRGISDNGSGPTSTGGDKGEVGCTSTTLSGGVPLTMLGLIGLVGFVRRRRR